MMLLRNRGMKPQPMIAAGTVVVSAAILALRYLRPGHPLSADRLDFVAGAFYGLAFGVLLVGLRLRRARRARSRTTGNEEPRG